MISDGFDGEAVVRDGGEAFLTGVDELALKIRCPSGLIVMEEALYAEPDITGGRVWLEDGNQDVLRDGGIDPSKDDGVKAVPEGLRDISRTIRAVDVGDDVVSLTGGLEELRPCVVLDLFKI